MPAASALLGAGSKIFESRGTTLLESRLALFPRCHEDAAGAGYALHSFRARSRWLDALLSGNGELPAGATNHTDHSGCSSRVAARRTIAAGPEGGFSTRLPAGLTLSPARLLASPGYSSLTTNSLQLIATVYVVAPSAVKLTPPGLAPLGHPPRVGEGFQRSPEVMFVGV
jgi:hypothetical protein